MSATFKNIKPDKSISLFVKNIMIFEEQDSNKNTILPFFADGYPGLLFHDTENGLIVNPYNKSMPSLSVYGQTINPVELKIQGKYKLIIFQFYPFILRSFFAISALEMNDNCYDLLETNNGRETNSKLFQLDNLSDQIAFISKFLLDIFIDKQRSLDQQIKGSIQLIVENNGQISIKDICTKTCLTERTLERRFLKETGISAKQFAKMIQFQQSYEQLKNKDYKTMTEIVYENGFADQSHFIRVFKAFTGLSPKRFVSAT